MSGLLPWCFSGFFRPKAMSASSKKRCPVAGGMFPPPQARSPSGPRRFDRGATQRSREEEGSSSDRSELGFFMEDSTVPRSGTPASANLRQQAFHSLQCNPGKHNRNAMNYPKIIKFNFLRQPRWLDERITRRRWRLHSRGKECKRNGLHPSILKTHFLASGYS